MNLCFRWCFRFLITSMCLKTEKLSFFSKHILLYLLLVCVSVCVRVHVNTYLRVQTCHSILGEVRKKFRVGFLLNWGSFRIALRSGCVRGLNFGLVIYGSTYCFSFYSLALFPAVNVPVFPLMPPKVAQSTSCPPPNRRMWAIYWGVRTLRTIRRASVPMNYQL